MLAPIHPECFELLIDTVVDAVVVAGLPWCLAIVAQRPDADSQPLCYALAWSESGRTRTATATATAVPASLAPLLDPSRQSFPDDHPFVVREINLVVAAQQLGLPAGSWLAQATSPVVTPLRSRLHSFDGFLLTEQSSLTSDDDRHRALLGLAHRLSIALDRSVAGRRFTDQEPVDDGLAAVQPRLTRSERLAHERLAAILESTDTIVLTFNAGGVIESLAGNAEALTGWKPEELVGKSLLELFPADGQDAIAKSLEDWEAEREDPVRTHLSMLHRWGRLVPIHYAAKPHTEAGTYVGGSGTLTDLSTVTLLRNELDTARTLHARFQGAVRTGRAVAHELGSPISTIMALTELLGDEPTLPPDIMADLHILRREALRASDLLHQFGRISRYAEVATPVGPQLDLGMASESAADGHSP